MRTQVYYSPTAISLGLQPTYTDYDVGDKVILDRIMLNSVKMNDLNQFYEAIFLELNHQNGVTLLGYYCYLLSLK